MILLSSPKWTVDQSEAIYTRGCNLLVSAAAGSGKTAVLVERIIRRITDESNGTDVDRLLVVTFTKAAAAEMRERISAAIVKELNKNPDSRHLNRQLILLNRASITTLHSFCLEVLRQYFYHIDLDPGFRVADDTEAALLRLDAIEDLFEECYSSGREDFLALVDAYGGNRDDHELQEIVLKLYDFSSSNPWPEEWLRGLSRAYRCPEGLPLDQTVWGREIMSWLELVLNGCHDKLQKAHMLACMPGGPDVYCDNLTDDTGIIDDLIRASGISWQEFHTVVNSVEFTKLKACRSKDVDETLKDRVKTIRESVKKIVNSVKTDLFSRTQEELIADLNIVAPLVESLALLVTEFGEKYRKAKTDRGLVDFLDLEHYCLRILLEEGSGPGETAPSVIARELQDYYDEVFVDEYQDINEVQETILELVSRGGTGNPNRFMVGDVKQSIYGFRLADPGLFMQKYESYPREKGTQERGIDLRQNFRSRGEVLDAVNFIFRKIMTPGLGGINYDSKAELVCGAEYPHMTEAIVSAAGPVEFHLLDKTPDEEDPGIDEERLDGDASGEAESDQEENEEPDALQREARFVGRRVMEMVRGTGQNSGPEFCIWDKTLGAYRHVQFRDIVVLLRTTRNAANVFIDEFRKLGVPAYADLGTGYFEAVEVETMMSLLKVIDNPRQDIPLAAVLRSPVVGLNARELAAVRLRNTSGEFYDAVRKSAELGETTVDLRLRSFLEKLENWRTQARQGTLSQLIWRLYDETDYYAYAGGMLGGIQRQANLRALHDRARQFEATSFRGLFRFLRFIEKFRESGSDLGAARALGEKEDVVRIISIHKSKGLEFPVVITAGLGKQFNFNDLKQKALLHKKMGIGMPVVDLNNCLTYQTLAQFAIKKRMRLDLLAEEMRILYVALTRAKEKLILVGSVNEPEKAASRWCEGVSAKEWSLPDFALSEARTFLDWLGPAAGDSSGFSMYIHEDTETPVTAQEEGSGQAEFVEKVRLLKPVEVDDDFDVTLEKNLGWMYPHANIVGKPAKASVTELKRRFSPEGYDETCVSQYRTPPGIRPRFLTHSSGLSAAERGSAMHLVMQHISLRGDLTEDEVKEQLQVMTENELLTVKQAEAVDIKAILGFFKSTVGQRAVRAHDIKRELHFTLAVPARRIYDDLDGNCHEQVLVQGVIDCLVSEDDGFVLIDYKTDTGPVEDIKEKYRGQLNLYAEAVEKLFGRPVREKFLYLFYHGREIRCD